ncbi:MAG TPA: methyltransferase domain-containing protein [Cyclobacteriaceae bacterium]|nr:methyltransferase domain-containing protein [Cyclobacteriaceae bacterium]
MSNYIHGSEPEEQARLAQLNELINKRCLDLLPLNNGARVLDIGSGLGQFTISMATIVGDRGWCLGIERDQNQLHSAAANLARSGRANVEFRKGNAENLELRHDEWGSFDLAHTRFVLEHVKEPENVVRGMARAVKSGGKVVLLDDDHAHFVLDPEPAGFSTIWQAYIRSYDKLGNDPFIGRRLVNILYQCGLRDIRNNAVFMGDSSESPTFRAYVTNLIGILEGAKSLMLRHGLIAEDTFHDAIAAIHVWAKRPDAALWYTINWAAGTKL